jgi:hypothetical protein
MLTERERIVVTDGLCACCAVHTKKAHHRDFPEVWAECGSVAEAVAHLADQLSRYREGAQSAWHREGIDGAIADVTAFLGALSRSGREPESACRCGVRVPDRPKPSRRERQKAR